MSRKKRRDRQFKQEVKAIAFNEQTTREGPTKKKWNLHDMVHIQPLTQAQSDLFHCFYQGSNVVGYGSAGTGKSFLAMYLGLKDVIDPECPQTKLIIVRSAVASRDIGHLPGTIEEKTQIYESPYNDICVELFRKSATYTNMKEAGLIEFLPTSFVRGTTWDDAIVILDETQNMTFHEISSVLTRVGRNTKIIMIGDVAQTDLTKKHDQSGFAKAINVAERMDSFASITFNHNDIVRSEFVKQWIIASESIND